ncbi:MAG TPA: quinohemoprotein amine dehydrogenase maturation protein [Steroidobacteraceae bacterium]|nr:quinohemoprotein amine dehydrogenase maturation protein [Steroidobacteraceae bacterium]
MTSRTLAYNSANAHIVRFDGRAMLLHVPTTALFELDELGQAVIEATENGMEFESRALRASMDGRFAARAVDEFVDQLADLQILQERGAHRPINPHRVKVESYPLSTLVLNVNTGCNLSCTYCYKEDLQTPARGQRMNFATASRSVDLLLRQAAERDSIGIVFFGGEPLTNMPLIREVVDYAERQAAQARKQVDFSLTTNATLLSAELIGFFDAHRFGISISMDGPKVIHDRHRRTVGGKGTYEVAARKARMLLERYRSKPVGARVTLSAGTVEVEAIHAHLRGELGFHEVGYAPVTSATNTAHVLSESGLDEVHAAFERLGEDYLQHALRGSNNGFSNMHQLLTDLHEGRRKALPCGAGVGLLAVDKDGGLNLCHRFTGSDLPTFGNVTDGIDAGRLGDFLSRAADRSGTHCATCRIRNLCAGGCYHEAYARFGDPLHRTYHYCNLLRRWVDFGVRIYTRILSRNPDFFRTHLEPRRSLA